MILPQKDYIIQEVVKYYKNIDMLLQAFTVK